MREERGEKGEDGVKSLQEFLFTENTLDSCVEYVNCVNSRNKLFIEYLLPLTYIFHAVLFILMFGLYQCQIIFYPCPIYHATPALRQHPAMIRNKCHINQPRRSCLPRRLSKIALWQEPTSFLRKPHRQVIHHHERQSLVPEEVTKVSFVRSKWGCAAWRWALGCLGTGTFETCQKGLGLTHCVGWTGWRYWFFTWGRYRVINGFDDVEYPEL